MVDAADCIIGIPAELYYMSCIAPNLRPKSVLLAADIATQSMIDRIKYNWKCNVFTHYGHTEFGYGCVVDCHQHQGLHLRQVDHIFEIIDPQLEFHLTQAKLEKL
jgi:phenylacetate-coenzyme A ligase PaaK-like adenylate-forming protein